MINFRLVLWRVGLLIDQDGEGRWVSISRSRSEGLSEWVLSNNGLDRLSTSSPWSDPWCSKSRSGES